MAIFEKINLIIDFQIYNKKINIIILGVVKRNPLFLHWKLNWNWMEK